MTEAADRPRHDLPRRPSRRQEITDAATAVFAQLGYANASVQDVADEAGVVASAVYYHFDGKDDLFDEVLAQAIASCDEVISAARPTDQAADPDALGRVMAAVWQWTVDNPAQAALLSGPLTATPESRRMRDEWEERHVDRGFDYLPPLVGECSTEDERIRRTLAIRALIRLTITVHVLRLPGGPLASHSRHALRRAVRDVTTRMVRY